MSETDVPSLLGDAIRDVLGQPDLVVTDDLTASDVEGWDSLAHVELIYVIEDTFDISFPADAIMDHEDVGALRRDIERLLADG
ncbi:MAG: acyl carrier protein [Acidimicrobiales bacterium]|nr:acyl carrier protein [Acidimicrobiales bacterium]